MATQFAKNMLAVREGWSEEERRVRKDLAGAMQLQLRALVVLSELSDGRGDQQEKQSISVASAC